MTDVDIEEHLEQIEWGRQQANGEVLLSPAWEVFILGVSILSVFNLVVVWLPRNPDIDMVFIIMDMFLTFFFVVDLLRRMVVADSIRRYLRDGSGWVDCHRDVPDPAHPAPGAHPACGPGHAAAGRTRQVLRVVLLQQGRGWPAHGRVHRSPGPGVRRPRGAGRRTRGTGRQDRVRPGCDLVRAGHDVDGRLR